MLSQIAGVYFQSYQLAYDLAHQAERAFRYELGIKESNYVQFGYWDNLKKGLLAGERLQADLRRLEVAYLEEHHREYELTKHISLAILNPMALLRLKEEEGRCEIELPEELFDLDYPGHYFRRIKSVSISIPAVTGPYTTLSCTLRLLRSSMRQHSTLLNGRYARDLDNDDARFNDSFGAIQSIATSSGQNDSGLFDLNFRDERYLPFEGAGAISRWQLEMPNAFRQFDYDSISDVILHIKYTAREGGGALRDAATQHLLEGLNALVTGDNAPGLHQAFSVRHDFPTEFHRFLHPQGAEDHHTRLTIGRKHFPYLFQARTINVQRVLLLLKLHDGSLYDNGQPLALELTRADGAAESADLHPAGALVGGLPVAEFEHVAGEMAAAEVWQLHVTPAAVQALPDGLRQTVEVEGTEVARLRVEQFEDIGLLLHYTVSSSE
jgi:hypothetical protein